MKWLVIYTKPNFEIKVSKALKYMGIKSYCPVYIQLKQYSDRRKKIQKPLLPSYVLVYIDNNDRRKVFSIPGVIRFVFWLGKPVEVSNNEIELMENNISGIYDNISISNLTKGSTYKIMDGPFRGYQSRVIYISNKKMHLELPNLGMRVT